MMFECYSFSYPCLKTTVEKSKLLIYLGGNVFGFSHLQVTQLLTYSSRLSEREDQPARQDQAGLRYHPPLDVLRQH
jgi:hypothetical protein